MLRRISTHIKNNYGSKVGFINRYKYFAIGKIGAFASYRNIDTQAVKRLVFICSGNICRSPLAEAVAAQKGISSISYGLHCRGGDKADPRAINFAQGRGIDLEQHRTRNINIYEARPGDLLIGMEPSHVNELKKAIKHDIVITLSGLWLSKQIAYIHDPFNANATFFEACESMVIEATEALIKQLR